MRKWKEKLKVTDASNTDLRCLGPAGNNGISMIGRIKMKKVLSWILMILLMLVTFAMGSSADQSFVPQEDRKSVV